MKKLTLIALALTIVGCTAVVKSPDETVATYNLYPDHLEALLVKECVDQYGVTGCTPYPNPMECTRLTIEIRADGRTWVDCRNKGNVVKTGFANIGDGVPFYCETNEDMSCQKCMDIFNNVVLDNCSRNTQSFRKPALGSSSGQGGFLIEKGDGPDGLPNTSPGTPDDTNNGQGNPTTPPNTTPKGPLTPNGEGGDICNPANAVLSFANELNKILAHEGFNFSWSPDLEKFLDPSKNFYGSKGYSGANNNCTQFASNIKSLIHQCAVKKNGQCYYCWDSGGGKKTCRCYRVNLAALKNTCNSIPAGCDRQAWSGAMIQAYGLSNQWLFSASYTSNFYGKINSSGSQTGGTNGGNTPSVPNFPQCKGSPLVLDLAGDGIKPSAPANGVTFDLMGTGQLKTAWIAGDDALLAMDRDGNGRIDSGAELFGDVTAGVPQEDGFEALGQLDSNSDGKVDAKDASYKKLVVWQDRNRDGVSQRSELRSLKQAGVKALGLGMTLRSGQVDRHGNELNMQGGFTRADGSTGLMVDVLFMVK